MTTKTLDRPIEADVVAIDPRIQARRDEVERNGRRRRQLRLAVLAGVVVLGGLLYLVTHSALLDVDRVEVEATPHLTTDQLRDASGVSPGDHLIDIDPGAVRGRLLGLPWVADAQVGVDWTAGDVHLTVTERTPVAAVPDGGTAWTLVDDRGHGVASAPAGDPGLIAIEGLAPLSPGGDLGPAADGALQIATDVGPGLRSRIVAVVVAGDGTIQLEARPDVVVKLCGADRLDTKLRNLTTFFAQVDDTDLATVDVCVPQSPIATRRVVGG